MSEDAKAKILIVDDDEAIRTQMKWGLADDYEVFLAEDQTTALATVEAERPAAVTLDLGLPPRPRDVTEGLATLLAILRAAPATKVVIITGRGEKEHALEAIANGAYDFLAKPVDIEELRVILRRAVHVHLLEREHQELLRDRQGDAFDDLVGSSEAMTAVFATIRKVATSDVPILVVGETGTGKELVARAVHRLSERRGGPFVAINCGAIPENLLESELFGHEKGAFTGAHTQRKGRVELAQRGTLLLDEIGELSPALQVKLLRYLQESKIQRVGGREDLTVDARVLAATNQDLRKAIAAGQFREDLFYRLSVVSVPLPPLRERGDDVELLAHHILADHARKEGRQPRGFSREALTALRQHSWPGNVRELENRIKRALLMAEGRRITPADLELDRAPGRRDGQTLREARRTLEREMVLEALARHRGKVTPAAAELGISRPTLYELMDKLGIARD